MKNRILLGCIGLITIISLVINYALWKNNESLKRVVKETSSTKQPISKETLITFGANRIIVTPSSVVVNEGFESHNPLSIVLDTKNYPDLFLPENEFARLHVEEITAGKSQNIKLIRIARQVPNHGSVEDGYYILFDPTIGKVVKTAWERLFGTVYLYSSSAGSALPMLEFTEYDQKQAKFILTNNEHKKEFQELLLQHEELQKKEICRINGEDMSLVKALQTAKAEDKCADWLLGVSNNKPGDDFITIGQYRSILNNIQKVVKGENIKIFDRM